MTEIVLSARLLMYTILVDGFTDTEKGLLPTEIKAVTLLYISVFIFTSSFLLLITYLERAAHIYQSSRLTLAAAS